MSCSPCILYRPYHVVTVSCIVPVYRSPCILYCTCVLYRPCILYRTCVPLSLYPISSLCPAVPVSCIAPVSCSPCILYRPYRVVTVSCIVPVYRSPCILYCTCVLYRPCILYRACVPLSLYPVSSLCPAVPVSCVIPVYCSFSVSLRGPVLYFQGWLNRETPRIRKVYLWNVLWHRITTECRSCPGSWKVWKCTITRSEYRYHGSTTHSHRRLFEAIYPPNN